jgi:3-deoxy-D-manno-octulosonic-acid transferase
MVWRFAPQNIKLCKPLFFTGRGIKTIITIIGIPTLTVSGDTRFDRVWATHNKTKEIPGINEFKNGQKVFIAGSTWPEDEAC